MSKKKFIEKNIFKYKVDETVLEKAKIESGSVGTTEKQKIRFGGRQLCYLAAVLLFVFGSVFTGIYLNSSTSSPNVPPEIKDFYFSESDLSTEEISFEDVPAEFETISTPLPKSVLKYFKDEMSVYYFMDFEYLDEMNYDLVTCKIMKANIHIDMLDANEYNEVMEYKERQIFYSQKYKNDMYYYNIKFESNGNLYYLKTMTLTNERVYFYLDQLLK